MLQLADVSHQTHRFPKPISNIIVAIDISSICFHLDASEALCLVLLPGFQQAIHPQQPVCCIAIRRPGSGPWGRPGDGLAVSKTHELVFFKEHLCIIFVYQIMCRDSPILE